MPTDLLPAIELSTGHNPLGTVIWLHGLGADGNDFVPVVRELALPEDKPLRFIFPHAPVRPVSLNNGYAMRAWFDMGMGEANVILVPGQSSRPGMWSSEPHIRESQRAVEALIEREVSRGIATEKIVLAGFSQAGHRFAHRPALPKKLAGVMALSTYLALAESLAAEKQAANATIPILMAHGRQDDVIPLQAALASRERLQSLDTGRMARVPHAPFSVSGGSRGDRGMARAKCLPRNF
jgi:phospholipase/carboxylesterase